VVSKFRYEVLVVIVHGGRTRLNHYVISIVEDKESVLGGLGHTDSCMMPWRLLGLG
jgi:hypothetical protein